MILSISAIEYLSMNEEAAFLIEKYFNGKLKVKVFTVPVHFHWGHCFEYVFVHYFGMPILLGFVFNSLKKIGIALFINQ